MFAYAALAVMSLCACGLHLPPTRIELTRDAGSLSIRVNGRLVSDNGFRVWMKHLAMGNPNQRVVMQTDTNVLASDLVQTLGILQLCGVSNSLLLDSAYSDAGTERWCVEARTYVSELPGHGCTGPFLSTGFYPNGTDNRRFLNFVPIRENNTRPAPARPPRPASSESEI